MAVIVTNNHGRVERMEADPQDAVAVLLCREEEATIGDVDLITGKNSAGDHVITNQYGRLLFTVRQL